jgi:ribose transport system permease protein
MNTSIMNTSVMNARRSVAAASAALTRSGRSTATTLAAVSVLGYAVLVATSHGSLLHGNAIQGVLTYVTVPVLIGLAQLIVLAVGQMNLSVGALGGFLSVSMGVLMADQGVPAWLAVLVGLAAGAAIGALNGVLVVATRINGFIVTLATMTILSGLQYHVVGTRTVNVSSRTLTDFGTASVAHIPIIFLVALAVAALLGFFLKRAAAGRRLLASGGNPLAAQLSGISTNRSIVVAHALSGLVIGIAAVLTTASSPGVNNSIGGDWLLPSFAAPIIGGAALAGGAVSVAGTVFAAFVVRLVDVARAQYSLDPSWVDFTVGAVVLGTVILGRIRESRQARPPQPPAAAVGPAVGSTP